jgi:hypothetical protein
MLSKSVVSTPISIDSVAYWRTEFDVNILSEVVLSQQTQITYGNMDIHYWYQTHATHSFAIFLNDNYVDQVYSYGSSPDSISYNEISFTGIQNGTYKTKIFVNSTGEYNHLYGDTFDLQL